MSTFAEVRNAIQIRFRTEFPSVLTALDNQNFTPPEPASGVKWVRLNVQFVGGSQDSLGAVGNRRFLKTGFLFIQVYTPVDSATNDNDELCQDAQDLFEGVSIGDIWFLNGRIGFAGFGPDWFRQDVAFEIKFEDIK